MTGEIDQEIEDLHWNMGLLQNLEVGLVVVDRDSYICMWNGFMVNHSGISASQAVNQNLFSLYPELSEAWLKKKIEAVLLLNNTAYISWEQKPYLFPFKSNRPITGGSSFMYQNVTLSPLSSPSGQIDHIGILIYDVTDNAIAQHKLEQANQQLKAMSRTDGLTGLYNRAYWQECLEKEFDRFSRMQETSSVIMFDIDHFKKVNDTYGHQAGDLVIQTIAKTLNQYLRRTDIGGRYGGEEYAAIMVGTSGQNALVFAERLRSAVESTAMIYGEHTLNVTISLGIAEVSSEQESALSWLEQADQALYKSKQNGRNRATLYQP